MSLLKSHTPPAPAPTLKVIHPSLSSSNGVPPSPPTVLGRYAGENATAALSRMGGRNVSAEEMQSTRMRRGRRALQSRTDSAPGALLDIIARTPKLAALQQRASRLQFYVYSPPAQSCGWCADSLVSRYPKCKSFQWSGDWELIQRLRVGEHRRRTETRPISMLYRSYPSATTITPLRTSWRLWTTHYVRFSHSCAALPGGRARPNAICFSSCPELALGSFRPGAGISAKPFSS